MNDDFNKYMQIIAGANIQQSQTGQLTDTDKKNLGDAYFQLFYNLTATNWIRGGTLGTAWYRAISQIKQFVASKNAANPVALYLRQIFAAHNARWAQLMMTSPHRDDTVDAPSEKKQEWQKRVARGVSDSLAKLNSELTRFEPRNNTNNNATQFVQPVAGLPVQDAAQKLKMIILMQTRQRQNGAMSA